ncbi:hypothetical protein NEISUBOT_04143 [Neisseria subflava NJ9703]|uniref:Uncharacterized protein n=1 Tax=Neisseria subflava NJ9703 TaxID=546268 RepID=A0A9W5IRB3_NEISU|nr:hypothetical protein NEISUBOT_04143 [Neisseria subflava NJ9703]
MIILRIRQKKHSSKPFLHANIDKKGRDLCKSLKLTVLAEKIQTRSKGIFRELLNSMHKIRQIIAVRGKDIWVAHQNYYKMTCVYW